jgi:NitT/TauT family transport system permease protein/taurine transport system permease protein
MSLGYDIDTIKRRVNQPSTSTVAVPTAPRVRKATPTRSAKGGRVLAGASAAVVLLAAWFLCTSVWGLVHPARFPSPAETWEAALQILTTGYAGGTLWHHVGHSLRLVAMGFLVAAVTGCTLGLAMGMSRRFELFINPTFLLLRPIPPLAWIPLALLWFGLGDASKIFVIWYAAFVPSVINTFTGVRMIDPLLVSAARVHGASQAQLIRHVLIPGALPMIFTGLKLSLQSSWMTLVAAELVGAFLGIGRVLIIASQDVYPGMILFAMACVAVLGAATTALLNRVEKWSLPWRTT